MKESGMTELVEMLKLTSETSIRGLRRLITFVEGDEKKLTGEQFIKIFEGSYRNSQAYEHNTDVCFVDFLNSTDNLSGSTEITEIISKMEDYAYNKQEKEEKDQAKEEFKEKVDRMISAANRFRNNLTNEEKIEIVQKALNDKRKEIK